MMRSTFFGLEIGRTGLSTAQFGLDTTGHNIANVDTQGYTRQRIVQTAYDPYSSIGRFAPMPGQSLVGGGTRVKILDQIRSAYLDRRFRTEVTAHTYWDTRAQSLTYIQNFFDNVNERTSINTSLANFFGSMNTLAADPLSQASRKLVQTTAMDMVQQLNMIYDGLVDLRMSENTAVKTTVEDINRIAIDIADLNKKIFEYEITGLIANDLRDKRNDLVDLLSEYIDIEYEEYHDTLTGSTRFKINLLCAAGRPNDPNGRTLIDHDEYSLLGAFAPPTTQAGEEPIWEIHWIKGFTESGDMIPGDLLDFSKITGGKLKAHLDVRDGNEFRYDGIVAATVADNPERISFISETGDEYRWNEDNSRWEFWDKVAGNYDTSQGVGWIEEVGGVFVDQNGDPPSDSDIRTINWGIYEKVQTNDSRYRGIPYYIEMMNDLARGLVLSINEIHREGWGDHPLGSTTNVNFFKEEPEWVTWTHSVYGEFRWDPDAISVGEGAWAHWDPATESFTGLGYITQNALGQYVDANGNLLDSDPVGFTRVLDISQVTAKNIDLDELIKDSEWYIACSSEMIERAGVGNEPENSQRHNNENIKRIYELFGPTNIVFSRPREDGSEKRIDITGFADYGAVIRFDVGNTLHTAKQTAETSRILRLAAENQKTAIAGVSLDEEMVGMVRYQHAYNGAARVITAMDEALDRLINGTGRVGL